MVRMTRLCIVFLLLPVAGFSAGEWPVDWLRPHIGTNGGGYSQHEGTRLARLSPWKMTPRGNEVIRIIRGLVPSAMYPGDIVWLARQLGSPLGQADRLQLWTRLRAISSDESLVSSYSNAVYGDGENPYNIMPQEPYGWYDFNRDGKADLFLATQGYFGPSYGYGVITLDTVPARILMNISSGLAFVQRQGQRTILRFDVMQIDQAEAQIEYYLIVDHRTGKVTNGPCLAYAPESLLPRAWSGNSRLVRAATHQIRKQPVVDNTAINPDEAWRLPGTSVLAGNIVAEIKPGSMVRELARLPQHPGWAFVSVSPENVRETSLRHGMDEEGPQKKPRVAYTVCGWLKLAP